MGITQLLLEQGYTFPGNRITQSISVKLLVGVYLKMAIILSNAYKSTNVYLMISPRIPIPNETISELVDSNFKMFSRSHQVIINGLQHPWHDHFASVQSLYFGNVLGDSGNGLLFGKRDFMQVFSDFHFNAEAAGLFTSIDKYRAKHSGKIGLIPTNSSKEVGDAVFTYTNSSLHPEMKHIILRLDNQ